MKKASKKKKTRTARPKVAKTKRVPRTREKPFKKPDFAGRMREIFGDKKIEIAGAEIIAWGRREYFED